MRGRVDILDTPSFTSESVLGDGSRVLLRGRRLHRADYEGERWPIAMTLEVRYPTVREDGLPSEAQHAAHTKRVMAVIDGVESTGVGVHVFGDTNSGLIREWFYVGSKDAGGGWLSTYEVPGGWEAEVLLQEDTGWTFYDDLVLPIRGDGAGW